MHKFFLLLLILLVLNSPMIANAQCSDTPQPPTYNCVGTPTPITGTSLPSMISGTKQYLFLTFCARITNTCGLSGVVHYLTLGLITAGVEKKALEFAFDQGTNYFEITTKFDNPSDTIFGNINAWTGFSLQGTWIEFYGSIRLTSSSAAVVQAGFTSPSGILNLGSSPLSSVSGYDDLKIYVGSATNSLNPVSVEIQDLRVDYFTGTTPSYYLGGLSATLLAYYQLGEGAGTILTDSQGGLGTAYLGSSTASTPDTDINHLPVWKLGGPGIDFTANTQYITLPNFMPQAANPVTPASLAVAFWLKLSALPTADGYIFRHSNSLLNFDNFAYQVIGGAWQLKVLLGNTLITNIINIGSDWTYVYIHVALKSNLQQWLSSIYTYSGASIYAYAFHSGILPTPFSFSSSDVARLGGPPSFIGKIAHFKIFSPGALALNQGQGYAYFVPGCTVSYLLQIGISTPTEPGLPGQETCTGTCSQCFNSQPTGCLACTGTGKLYNSTCVSSCSPGSYTYNSAFCIDCPPGCATCTDGSTCQSCKTGFALVGTLCPCHPTCKTCTNNQLNGCLTCNPGDNFYKSQCLASCPRGTYAVDSVCLDCPDSCPVCDGYGNCMVPSIVAQSVGARSAVQTVVQSTLLASSFLLGGGYGRAASISVLSKMILYIRYIHISYSDELLYALQNWTSSFFTIGSLINMPETVGNDVFIYKDLPAIFTEYGVHPSFLNNYWDDILIFAMTIAILSCFLLLEFAVRKSYKLSLFAYIKKARVKTQKFFLTLLYEGYGDIIFFSVMEFRSMNIIQSYTALSFCFSCLFNLIGLSIFAFHIHILYKHQKQKIIKTAKTNTDTTSESIDHKSIKHEGIQEFFLDFKDRTFIQQAFLLVFVFRNILFNLTLTNLFEKPLTEAALLMSMSVLMLVYLITNRPLGSFLELSEIILYEFVLLIVNLLILIMASQDERHILDMSSRTTMCWIIIYISISLNFVPLFFTFINLVMKIRDIYQKWRARKRQPKLIPSQTLPSQAKTNVKNNSLHSYLHVRSTGQLKTKVKANDVSMESNSKQEILENSDASLINDSFVAGTNSSLNSPLKGLIGELNQTSSSQKNEVPLSIMLANRSHKQDPHQTLVPNMSSILFPNSVPEAKQPDKDEIISRKQWRIANISRVIKNYTAMEPSFKVSNEEHKDTNNSSVSKSNSPHKE